LFRICLLALGDALRVAIPAQSPAQAPQQFPLTPPGELGAQRGRFIGGDSLGADRSGVEIDLVEGLPRTASTERATVRPLVLLLPVD
jgi:hypothetical protein